MINEKSLAGFVAASGAIPNDVYYSLEHDNFYLIRNSSGMGMEFHQQWKSRAKEFPSSWEIQDHLGTCRDTVIARSAAEAIAKYATQRNITSKDLSHWRAVGQWPPDDESVCKRGDDVFLVGGKKDTPFVDVFIKKEDAELAILKYIFEDPNSWWIGKLTQQQQTILCTLKAANATFDVILHYYNSVAGESDKWVLTEQPLR